MRSNRASRSQKHLIRFISGVLSVGGRVMSGEALVVVVVGVISGSIKEGKDEGEG